MSRAEGGPVLALGIDAAQGSLVRELAERGELPALAGLLERGSWSHVTSTAFIGSGSVWPTFATGSLPWEHGWYSEWSWDPDRMQIARMAGRRLEPFWRRFDGEVSVGVVDVPFSHPVPLSRGFELTEWGSHERVAGRMLSSPPELAGEVARDLGPHPLWAGGPPDPDNPGAERITAIAEAARSGIRLRGELGRRLLRERDPDLLMMIFSELHHTGHLLWHTVEPEHPLYAGKALPRITPSLVDLYREVDEQIGSLIDIAGEDARVVVFALHGMEAGGGLPSIAEPVLEERGLGRRVDWRQGSWGQRARSAFGGLKRRMPAAARHLYYRHAPLAVNRAIARPTLVPPWEWSETRAFTLNTDQHCWLRVNLSGREREGTVPAGAYDDTCYELEDTFRSLTDDAGRPLVEEAVRVAELAGGPPRSMPDLVLHWSEAAFADPVRVAGSSIEARPYARRLIGRHALDGFCVSAGNGAVGESIDVTELHRVLRP